MPLDTSICAEAPCHLHPLPSAPLKSVSCLKNLIISIFRPKKIELRRSGCTDCVSSYMKLFGGGLWWVAALSCLLACVSFGAGPTRDPQHEARIEQDLGREHPELVADFHAATVAGDQNDAAKAIELYRKVVKAAPTFDPALRRLGAFLAETDERREGIEWCRKAVAIKRSAANLYTLATSLGFGKEGTRTREEKKEAIRLLAEARSLPDGNEVSNLGATAELALNLQDELVFRDAVRLLRRDFPDDLSTHYFGAIVEAFDEHWIRAEREIKKAEALGLSKSAVQQFLDAGVHDKAVGWEWALGLALVVGGWVAGLGLLFGLGMILSKLTLRSAERADPNLPLNSGERKLRSVYKVLLTFAGVYYYISLPIVLVMVLGICGGIIYGFLAIGWVPIKLTIILAIGAFVTVAAMIKSFFIKSDATEPGRLLPRDEAAGLWQMVEDVAREMGTRPVDEIRLTPGCEVAVYERGNWREKIRDQGKRILLLGTGVLNGFKQDSFRSVLAHEYGHFSHRDTAGGDVALRVRSDMFKFYRAMYAAGQATTLNVAFHFLRIYNFIFRRISHGATRLQEILADRVAAQAYGTAAFESGLRHVVRRGLEFDQVANSEIEQVIKSKQPLQHLYEAQPSDLVSIEKAFAAAIDRPTTDDDTHPSPSDRFRLLAGVRVEPKPELQGEVWDLFSNREAIKREMLAVVEAQIARFRER